LRQWDLTGEGDRAEQMLAVVATYNQAA